jgi:hypothetical protein
MLIRKTGRQLRPPMLASMINPARTGPPTEHRPSRGPKALKAFGQHVLGKGLGHDRYALRDEKRAERTLGDPRDDEHGRARCQAADG